MAPKEGLVVQHPLGLLQRHMPIEIFVVLKLDLVLNFPKEELVVQHPLGLLQLRKPIQLIIVLICIML